MMKKLVAWFKGIWYRWRWADGFRFAKWQHECGVPLRVLKEVSNEKTAFEEGIRDYVRLAEGKE